jgi:hypothetical protein
MKLHKWIHFKDDRKSMDLMYIHWSLAMIVAAMSGYCQKHKLRLQITDSISTYAEDTFLKRVSRTHREGRAIDLSVRGWEKSDIEMFVDFWNGHHYNKDYGAISASTMKPKLVYYHDAGHGKHLHIQVKGVD